ncbi:M23 family peptidase [Dysgonomonas sp. 216]|uniref:M23 family metallopeptidase n=1 Tax=Dysgonomonas sp. 216 TaxID=2302934 RepID=UPI0013D15A9C|nr:M23 family metallopeptidase [Dysgonomonas sp. 216]NDW18047.1 M23 family peptidase [Dysgonomonas sp. 216]
MKKLLITIYTILIGIHGSAQQYEVPVKIPVYLSGSFAELRNNHFHSGIDIKTQGVINKPIYSFADGYVSRILVSSSGFGLALYVTHPETGHVTVYGHLKSFTPKIAAYIKEKQYEEESFRVNLFPEPERFPVKKGELIAYSGNTGSSGGPHLHFDVRDAITENPLNPLAFVKNSVKDNLPPDVRGIAVYPVEGEGVVNNSRQPLRQTVTKLKSGQYSALKTAITAWGTIGVGVKAYDRMDGTSNTYGVRTIRLFVDETLVYESEINEYSFEQTRMINSFIDFYDWRINKSFFMRSFIEPGNTLPFYKNMQNNGYITIDEEKVYKLRYELVDLHGNMSSYSFNITGKQQNIPSMRKGLLYMVWDKDNYYLNDNFSLVIPKGNLYDNCIFNLVSSKSQAYYSDIFTVNDVPVPIHDKAEMTLKLTSDTLINKDQYGIVSIKNGKDSWVGGAYDDGYMTTTIREMGGVYAVSYDNVPPVVLPVNEQQWIKNKAIKLKVTDNKSGVKLIRGTIDGQFALFENDVKSPVYTYQFDPKRLEKGRTHVLNFTATDAGGNTTEYTTSFYY